MIAKGLKAHGFWNTSMTLTLDPASLGGWPQGGSRYISEDRRPWNYIFCSDELPEFCRLLLEVSRNDDSVLRDTVLYIAINPMMGNGEANEIDGYSAGRARMRKHFGPLHHLHSFGAAMVNGPLSGSYKGAIIASLRKHCPTAMDIIHETMDSLSQADEINRNGQLLKANLRYKAALSLIRSCCWRCAERDFVMSSPFPGLTAEHNISNMVVRLQARIAAVYFESGQLRMARIYTERAIDPRRPYDHRNNKMYTLSIELWEGIVYAEVLHVASRISYAHGDVHEARSDLWDAGQLVPFDEEQESRYAAWRTHSDILHDRRARQASAAELQSQKRDEKTEGMEDPESTPLFLGKKRLTLVIAGMFLVACNWKKKGDRLLRGGRSDLAALKYMITISKIDGLKNKNRDLDFELRSETFKGYRICNAIKALSFKVQASVAVAFLMSRMYRDVWRSTDAALTCDNAQSNCKHGQYDHCDHTYWSESHEWMKDQRLDYLRLYQCRALALKRMGDTVHAVENMEKALGFDPGDSTVLMQLVSLKQKLEREKARHVDKFRNTKTRNLNVEQDRLRKKQTSRRLKAQE